MPKIEIAKDPRRIKHYDQVTGEFLNATSLTPESCSVKVNGITSAYCDGPKLPVNIIRPGLASIREDIIKVVESHYGSPVVTSTTSSPVGRDAQPALAV